MYDYLAEKRQRRKQWIGMGFLVVLFVYSVTMGIYAFSYYHEYAHVQIFKYFGHDAEMVVNPLGISYTYPVGYYVWDRDMEIMHSLNEIVGYHFGALIWNFWIMFIIFMAFVILSKRR